MELHLDSGLGSRLGQRGGREALAVHSLALGPTLASSCIVLSWSRFESRGEGANSRAALDCGALPAARTTRARSAQFRLRRKLPCARVVQICLRRELPAQALKGQFEGGYFVYCVGSRGQE